MKVARPVRRGEQRKRTWSTKQRALLLPDNRSRNCVKVLYFVGDGLVNLYKRLELGTFEASQSLHAADGVAGIGMRLSELTLIFEGIELSSVRRRKRWRREVQPA